MIRVLAAGVVAAAAVAGLSAAAIASTAQKPSLRLVSIQPLKIRGVYFRPRERVRVRAAVENSIHTRSTRTTDRGSFAVAFVEVAYDPCSTFLLVTAVGAHGERAALKLPQRECPPG